MPRFNRPFYIDSILRGLALGLVLVACLGFSAAAAAHANDAVTWAFAFKNDFYFNSDNQYTGGATIQMYSALAPSLGQTHGTPAFGKSLARLVLPQGAGLSYREGWEFGQTEQTPTHLGEHRLITNDFAYMGLLGWGNTFIAFNNRNLYGLELLLGWVGPPAGGKQVQTAIHSITGPGPQGWHNQLSNQPIVNFYYTFQHKLWRRPSFDLASSLDAALGDYFTYGQTGLVARFGQLPPGFAAMPDPLGRGIHYDAIRIPRDRGYFYATLALRGTAIGYSLARQGNIFGVHNAWTEQNTLRMNHFIGHLIAGVNYVRPHWGVHFNIWMTTHTVASHSLTPASDNPNNFGEIRFDWRFN